MIVIDVGCATHGGDESIAPLVEEFSPDVLIGLDPAVKEERRWWLGDTYVVEEPFAAWTFDGRIGFTIAGIGGHVDVTERPVPCYDLARLVREGSQTRHEVVVKLDCEGSEYELIPHLVARDVDRFIHLMLVEWHCSDCHMGIRSGAPHRDDCPGDTAAWAARRDAMKALLRCEVQEWNR